MSSHPAASPAGGQREQVAPAQQAAVLDALPAQVALLDADGIIVAVNEAWRRFGDEEGLRAPDHGIGLNYLQVCASAEGDAGEKSVAAAEGIRAVLAGTTDTFELEYPCHSPTTERWFALRVVPLDKSSAAGAVVMHIDITQRVKIARDLARLSRETSQREKMLSTMLSASADLTYAIDRQGRLLYANEASLNLWGVTLDEARGMDTRDLGYPPDLSRRIREQLKEVFRRGRPVTDEAPFTSRTGQLAYYEYIFSPALAADGSVEFVVGCSRDITARKQSEQALRESAAQLRTLASAMPQIVWVSEGNGAFTYLSDLWEEYTGRSCRDSLGREWLAAVHPADRQAAEDACRASNAGSASSVEVRLARKDGAYRWWLFRGVPVSVVAGQPEGCIGTWTDIDELKSAGAEISRANRELQVQRNELRTLLDLVPASLWFKDVQGRIVQLNERAAQAMGKTVEQAIGLLIADVYPDRAQRYDGENRDIIRSGQALMGQLERARNADGSESWFQSDKVPYRDDSGNVVGIIVMKQDITERKRVQDALHELNLHLETRVAERTAELSVAQQEAVRADRAKSTFLATMSHEIRTPMSGLLGLLELLEFTPLDEGQRSTLAVARDSGETLKRLVDGILDFSKIESGLLELDPKPAPLRSVVGGICALHRPAALAKNIELAVEVHHQVSEHLVFDALRVGQILHNLIGNAIKFTERGAVRVQVEVQQRSGPQESLRLTVSDSGIGIAPEKIGQLFRPFVQADASIGPQYGGTGLGLFISRRLAERMGGSLALASVAGQGTTVELTVAFDRCEAAPLPPSAVGSFVPDMSSVIEASRNAPDAGEAAARGMLLLVVDDHPVNRMLLLRQASMLGYPAEAATEGGEALRAWESGRFAAIITDCNMPGMNGFDLARTIRQREAGTGRRTPIIGCTANAMAEAAQACLDAGMDESVTKPVGLQDIYTRLNRWVPRAPPQDARPDATVPAAAEGPGEGLLDLANLDMITGGDRVAMAEVIQDFRRCNDEDTVRLRLAVEAADHPQVKQLAHRISGACATLGADRLAATCRRLEGLAAASGLPGALQSALAALERDLAELNAVLASLD